MNFFQDDICKITHSNREQYLQTYREKSSALIAIIQMGTFLIGTTK